MLGHDSDLAGLEPHKSLGRSARKWFESAVVMLGLLGGGAGMGYWAGVQQTRQDSLAEITRLQQAYGSRIDTAATAATSAAAAATNAAEAVGEAAQSATTAANAAKSAAEAAKSSKKPEGKLP